MASFTRDPTSGPPQGRYELGELIATGGMGSVHRAFDRLAQRQVAYKRMRVAVEAHRPRITALFRREYDTLARLAHPNIVSVYEFGVDAHGPYYTMELVSGDDLAKRGRIPVREACRIARDVASALALVHARRLIHRDVSPNNVRLTVTDDARLIDFGALTGFGTPAEVVGTPQFVAPECLTSEPIDQRVDLYSLGALLYFMLTRQVAVRAASLEDLPPAWELPIPPPSSLAPEVPPALDDLVMQLLRIDRDARPNTAGEVVERLTSIGDLAPERDERRVAFSYLEHPPLQGRDAQVAQAELALDALMDGRGGVLRVEGSPGTGRSALLEQIGIAAQLRGATVLRAAGSVHSTPLAAALHLVRAGLAVYPELGNPFRERHSSVMMEPTRAADPTEAAERQARVAASVQDTLLQLGLRTPLVLLIDDAQRVDAQSLGVLASIAERLGRHPILIALSRVPTPAASNAEAILFAHGSSLSVAPLSERDVRELVQTMFGGVPNSLRLAHWLFVESGGNPRHCLGLVGWLLDHGTARYARGTFTLPSTIEEKVGLDDEASLRLDRLARLGEGPLALARLLALGETSLDVMQLAQASGTSTAQVLEDLRALDGANLTVSAEGRYRLLSRALSELVEAQLAPDARRPLHLALAAAVSTADALPPEQLAAAMHQIRAGGDDALTGALRIVAVTRKHPYELLVAADARRPLSAAVEQLGQRGYTDLDLAHMLSVLAANGFYGDLEAQRLYFDRAARAHYALTGLHIAVRLRPFVGPTLALVLGMMLGLATKYLRRARLPRQTLRESLVNLTLTVGPAVAAAACALDTPEAERVVRYLDPLASLPERSALQVMRSFCLAVIDSSAGRHSRADQRFRHVLAHLDSPSVQFNQAQRAQLREGCLHGIAETGVEDHPVEALAAADQLAQTTFFGPHAELVRMYHHGWRGARVLAEVHRSRAEALALLGDSWSAVVLIDVRALAAALLTEDVLEVVRLEAEFERLARLSPALAALHTLTRADVLSMRGRPQEALPLFAAALGTEAGRRQPLYRINCARHAGALLDSGRAEEAKRLCTRVLAEVEQDAAFPLAALGYLLELQLARAEASLGAHAEAAARVDALLARFSACDNPSLLGSLHRDRARVALEARDLATFEQHFGAMRASFASTRNQWLIQQGDALLARAVRAGLKPAVPGRPSLATSELDGDTAMELRTTEESPADTVLELHTHDPKSSRTG